MNENTKVENNIDLLFCTEDPINNFSVIHSIESFLSSFYFLTCYWLIAHVKSTVIFTFTF